MFYKKKSQSVSSSSNTLHLKNRCIFSSTPLCKVRCSIFLTDSCPTEEQVQGWQSLKTACCLLLQWLFSLPICFALPGSTAYPALAMARGRCASSELHAPPRTAPHTQPWTWHDTLQVPACLHIFGAANLLKGLCWKRTFKLHRGMMAFDCCTLRLTTWSVWEMVKKSSWKVRMHEKNIIQVYEILK